MEEQLPELIEVRHSAMRDMRQCPLKFKLGWLDNWEKEEKSDALTIGDIWHDLMRVHYLAIQRGLVLAQVRDLVFEHLDAEYGDSEHLDKIDWMYEGYLEEYGLDLDWEVLSVEQTLTVPLLERDGSPTRFAYRWTSDLLVRERSTGHIVVVDNKTTKNVMKKISIDLDDQFGLYVMAWRKRGRPALYAMYNGVRTEQLKRPMVSSERFMRHSSHRTNAELANIEQDALDTCEAMYPAIGPARLYSAPDPRVCGWKCEFLGVHLTMRKAPNPDRILPALMRSHGFVKDGSHGQRRAVDEPID